MAFSNSFGVTPGIAIGIVSTIYFSNPGRIDVFIGSFLGLILGVSFGVYEGFLDWTNRSFGRLVFSIFGLIFGASFGLVFGLNIGIAAGSFQSLERKIRLSLIPHQN